MSINKVQLRASVRKAVGVPEGDPDLTNDEIDLYLNRSLWYIMDKFEFREKERAGAFETIRGIRNYELPTPVEAMRAFAVVDPLDQQTKELKQMDVEETENRYNEDERFYGKPTHYFLENCYVRLWPTPDKVYKIQFHKWTILDDIGTNGITIPDVWNDIVLDGGIARAFKDFGDISRSAYYFKLVKDACSEMTSRLQKEIVDTSYAGVYVPHGRYDNQC